MIVKGTILAKCLDRFIPHPFLGLLLGEPYCSFCLAQFQLTLSQILGIHKRCRSYNFQ